MGLFSRIWGTPPVHEIMAKIQADGHTVRAWINWPEPPTRTDIALARLWLYNSILQLDTPLMQSGLAAKKLAKAIRWCNAIEVLDHEGNGALYYPSWP